MRFIDKNRCSVFLLNRAHINPPENANEAGSRWKNFREKSLLLNHLLIEQFYLCAYSELRADKEDLGYHIEHVRPKSLYSEETFDYNNLVASALSSEDLSKLRKEEIFGGHAKLDNFNADKFISPLSADCQKYFKYLSEGRVVPSLALSDHDKARAEYTISILQLNSPLLVNKRRRYWDELEKYYNHHLQDNASLEDLASVILMPFNSQLESFFSLARQFFGPIAENVLQE